MRLVVAWTAITLGHFGLMTAFLAFRLWCLGVLFGWLFLVSAGCTLATLIRGWRKR